MSQNIPQYLMIEGMDGSGKTSVTNAVTDLLQKRGVTVVRLREPGGTPIAEHLRTLLLGTDYGRLTESEDLTPVTEMLLMLAARSQTMAMVKTQRAERPNACIVAERGYPSTYAYQVVDADTEKLYNDTYKLLAPESKISVLLTCSYEVSLERRTASRPFGDRIEQRLTKETFDHIGDRYRSLPGGYDLVIDTDNLSIGDVVRQIMDMVNTWESHESQQLP